jgi:cytoskeletal protein CcmA (bactofilin family)
MFLRAKGGAAGAPGREFSFIGPEVTVTGNVETSGRMHLDGTVVGDVRCGALVQGEKGCVTGNIVADEAQLAGLVDGAVEAGALALEATARITGDVLYDSVAIARGAEVDGRFRRRKGEGGGSAQARQEAASAEAETALGPDSRLGAKVALAELFPAAPEAEAEAAE